MSRQAILPANTFAFEVEDVGGWVIVTGQVPTSATEFQKIYVRAQSQGKAFELTRLLVKTIKDLR